MDLVLAYSSDSKVCDQKLFVSTLEDFYLQSTVYPLRYLGIYLSSMWPIQLCLLSCDIPALDKGCANKE